MIELLVVMAILGVLSAALLPLGETLLVAQRERELHHALLEIRTALDEYKKAAERDPELSRSGGSGYPPNLQILVDGIPDRRIEAKGRMLYFLRKIPRDPFADPNLPPASTWRLRSYASPPDQPAPGADVYDVHSSSDGVALDGTLYVTW